MTCFSSKRCNIKMSQITLVICVADLSLHSVCLLRDHHPCVENASCTMSGHEHVCLCDSGFYTNGSHCSKSRCHSTNLFALMPVCLYVTLIAQLSLVSFCMSGTLIVCHCMMTPCDFVSVSDVTLYVTPDCPVASGVFLYVCRSDSLSLIYH